MIATQDVPKLNDLATVNSAAGWIGRSAVNLGNAPDVAAVVRQTARYDDSKAASEAGMASLRKRVGTDEGGRSFRG